MDVRLACRRYRLSFRKPVRTSAGVWALREGVYVRAELGTGAVGFGEAAVLPAFGTETLDEALSALDSLGATTTLEEIARVTAGLPALRNALGQALGAPSAPVHRSLPVAALLPAGRDALAAAPPLADAGFRTFKWKVGVLAADDERAILDDLLATLPEASRVRLDANRAWDARTADRWLDFASCRPVEFVEEPVGGPEEAVRDALRGLAADYPVPVALDESVSREGDVRGWIESGWPGVYVIKPSLLGDPGAVLASLAAAGSKVVFSSALETALGARAALRAAFAWSPPSFALGFGVWPLFEASAFDGPRAAPFLSAEDIERINPEALWNAAT